MQFPLPFLKILMCFPNAFMWIQLLDVMIRKESSRKDESLCKNINRGDAVSTKGKPPTSHYLPAAGSAL
jgi:hypothetical protein